MPLVVGAREGDGALIGDAGPEEILEIVPGRAIGIVIAEIVDGGASIQFSPPAVIGCGLRHRHIDGLNAQSTPGHIGILIILFVDRPVDREIIIHLHAYPMRIRAGFGRDRGSRRCPRDTRKGPMRRRLSARSVLGNIVGVDIGQARRPGRRRRIDPA